MKEIIWKPELHRFRSCKEFVEELRLGASDLILTNEYIYQPYFGAMNLECAVLYQEQYGMGEPTDVMAEAILRDAAATGCSRVVAIGGGTGLSTMLRGLKNHTKNLTAIVTVADDGGGSGRLRQDLGMPPPGDIRHCMEALANVEPVMQQLLTYRFPAGSGGDSFRAGGAAHGFFSPFCSFFSWRRCSFWRWRALSAFSLSSADAAP